MAEQYSAGETTSGCFYCSFDPVSMENVFSAGRWVSQPSPELAELSGKPHDKFSVCEGLSKGKP